MVSINSIVGHLFILRCQLLVFSFWNDRIHKETTRITNLLWVRKFRITDVSNRLTEFCCSRILYALFCQCRTNITIIELRLISLRKAIGHRCDKILIAPFMLKLTLSIAIFAISILEMMHFTSGNLHRFNLINQVFSFHTIGSDILYSTRTALTRNDRKVFCTIEIVRNTIVYKIIPYVSRATTYTFFVDLFDKGDARVEYGSLEITSE